MISVLPERITHANAEAGQHYYQGSPKSAASYSRSLAAPPAPSDSADACGSNPDDDWEIDVDNGGTIKPVRLNELRSKLDRDSYLLWRGMPLMFLIFLMACGSG